LAAEAPTSPATTASTGASSWPRPSTSTCTSRKHTTFQEEIIVKYSKLERVSSVDQIEHPIVREALKLVGVTEPHIELTSMADIPGGTGLGSSGSFTTALLKALHAFKKNLVSRRRARRAGLRHRDQQARGAHRQAGPVHRAVGGITAFTFHKDGRVEFRPCKIAEETLYNLEDNLLLFFTGYSRSASSILKDQNDRSKKNDSAMLDNLHFTKELGYKSLACLEAATWRSSPC
jgi:D-glycero-alpha-D-manno-heptose-7-phosphate kinase